MQDHALLNRKRVCLMLVVNPLFPPVTARPSMPLHPSGARSESLQQPIAGRGRVRRTPIRPIDIRGAAVSLLTLALHALVVVL
jgi:hypothetical protein